LKFLILLSVFVISISLSSIAYAQIMIGERASQEPVEITVIGDGDVHVLHELIQSNNPISFQSIDGDYTNLKVTDPEGNEIEHAISPSENNFVLTIFNSKTNVIVEYDLQNAFKNNAEVWRWNYLYVDSATSLFVFEEDPDIVFVNRNPVHMKGNSFNCHGCQMKIEYIIDEPTYINKINWENEEFHIVVRTLGDISTPSFNQPKRSISFDVYDTHQFFTMVIPLELLWNPYDVYLNNKKIEKSEFFNNGTHVWLNFIPEEVGNLEIIGISAIPEFSLLIPIVVVGMTIVILLPFKNKIILH